MRIVIVTSVYPPGIGGTATRSADLVDTLRARGYEVTVLTLRSDDQPAVKNGTRSFPRSWPWPLRHLAISAWLLVRRHRYEAVYAIGLHAAAVLGCVLARRPVVVEIAGDLAWERARRRNKTDLTYDYALFEEHRPAFSTRGIRFLRNWALRRASAIAAPSQYLAGFIQRWVGRPVEVKIIRYGIRNEMVAPSSITGAERLRAVYVGRLLELKKVDAILEAVAARPEVDLVVVGDGPELLSLERLADSLELGERVRFTGAVSREEAMRHIAEGDVLILASLVETLSHVAIEALAYGKPVITTPAGGVLEVVEHMVNGIVTDGFLPADLASALGRLSGDSRLRVRLANGAKASSRNWTLDASADRVEETIRSVVKP